MRLCRDDWPHTGRAICEPQTGNQILVAGQTLWDSAIARVLRASEPDAIRSRRADGARLNGGLATGGLHGRRRALTGTSLLEHLCAPAPFNYRQDGALLQTGNQILVAGQSLRRLNLHFVPSISLTSASSSRSMWRSRYARPPAQVAACTRSTISFAQSSSSTCSLMNQCMSTWAG